MNSITDIVLILLGSQSFLLAAFLFLTKRGMRISNIVLGFFSLNLALQVGFYYLSLLGIDVSRLRFCIGVFLGPLLFLYVKSLLSNPTIFSPKWFLHFLFPFGIYLIFPFVNNITSLLLITGGIFTSYLATTYIYFRNHRDSNKENSSNSSRISAKWILIIVYILAVIAMLDLAELFSRAFLINNPINELFNIVKLLGLLFIINYFIFFGSTQTKSFLGIIEAASSKPKYASIELSKKESVEVYNKISHLLLNEELYLGRNIKISDLAKLINVPVNKVSRSINENFGSSFSNLLNSKRVECAKKLLSDPKNNDKLFAIALDSGFNNKVSFYKNFKNQVGISPAEYREKIFDNCNPRELTNRPFSATGY